MPENIVAAQPTSFTPPQVSPLILLNIQEYQGVGDQGTSPGAHLKESPTLVVMSLPQLGHYRLRFR